MVISVVVSMSSQYTFGQLVIGPPGSGKTTYCNGMQQLFEGIGRKVAVVNIDPANDILPYKCSIDVANLINLTDVMTEMKLGPNGGLVYCMEYLEKNLDWLFEEMKKFPNHYFLFDCPGQVELYTHHSSVKNIAEQLCKNGFQLCAVHLVDSHYCSDPGKFIAVLLTSLTTMLQVELPFINVLSKADLIEKYGKLQFNVDFYAEVLDLSFLLDCLDEDPFMKKYKKLNSALVGLIEDYSLVSYQTLNIQDKESALNILRTVDKANGYIYGTSEEKNVQKLLSTAVGADFEYFKTATVRENYVASEEDNAMET